MIFAYADPPYPGQEHLYDGPGVNHELLIAHLHNDFDGWALSTSSNALQEILPMCPEGVRVASWSKPWASIKPGQRVAYTWEPIIFDTPRLSTNRAESTRDSISAGVNRTHHFIGAKPQELVFWIFRLLGILPGDEFVDLFHGSGAVQQAADIYKRQTSLFGGQIRPRDMKLNQASF